MWHVSGRSRAIVASRTLIAFLALSVSSCQLRLIGGRGLSDTSGPGASSESEDPLPISLTVTAAYPVNGASWMDYIKNDGSDLYSALDGACAGNEASYSDCIHGGEMRKVPVTGVGSCSGLSMSDALGVFEWTCVVKAGTATFFSTGFRSGKGLKDLLDATAFKKNSVTLSGTSVGSSTESTWWSNPVEELPDNSAPGAGLVALANATYPEGTILTLSLPRPSAGYNLTGARLALVTLGTAELKYNGDAAANCNGADQCLLLGSGNFLWVEGRLDGDGSGGTSADHLFYGGGGFTRYHGMTLRNASNAALYLRSGHSMSVTNVAVTGGLSGILVSGVDGNLVRDSSVVSAANAAFLVSGDGNTLRRIHAINGANSAVGIGGSNNLAFDIHVNGAGFGLDLGGSATGNVAGRLSISNCVNQSIRLRGNGVTGNVIVQATVQGASAGVELRDVSGNVLAQITSVNNGSTGMSIFEGSDLNTVHQFLTANNDDSGITFAGVADNVSNTFSQIAALNNDDYGIDLLNTSNTSKFAGTLIVGDNVLGNCHNTGGTDPGLVDADCTTTGADGSNTYTAGFASNATLRTQRTTAAAFYNAAVSSGKVTSDDLANASDGAGSASFPADPAAFDWTTFDNPFRLWGKDGSAYPNADHQGRWTMGQGRIWDWRLASSDTNLLDKSGDGSTLNQAFVAGGACPSAADGNQVAADLNGRTYLLNAVEIVDPEMTGYGSGNHNGLCESNERCVYTPNFGAYQGHGTLGTCAFADGTVAGVTLYGYGANGI